MPRLSIVIPSIAFDDPVEQTLVSVLQNRPEYSEVIVITARQYADPYGLGREVRFLTGEMLATRIDLINQGWQEARGEVVHVLLPGAIALDGWTDHVSRHFTDETVAAVAPVLMPETGGNRAVACGVAYSAMGTRRVVGAGIVFPGERAAPSVLAPPLVAGFYRRTALAALEGFDRELGELLADIELGLALQDLGLTTVVEPLSRVKTGQPVAATPRTFGEARRAERLFRRQSSKTGTTRLGHSLLVAAEFVLGFPRVRMITRLAGRLAARRESDPRPRYEARLERAREELNRFRTGTATIPMPQFVSRTHRSAA